MRQQAADVARDGVEDDVQPASDRVIGRVLPRLKAIAVGKVVRRFPVVEGLVAVLDRREGGGDDVRG